jgi:hypothetical protein
LKIYSKWLAFSFFLWERRDDERAREVYLNEKRFRGKEREKREEKRTCRS